MDENSRIYVHKQSLNDQDDMKERRSGQCMQRRIESNTNLQNTKSSGLKQNFLALRGLTVFFDFELEKSVSLEPQTY